MDPDNYPPDRPFAGVGLLVDRAFKYDVRTLATLALYIEAPAHFYEGGRDFTSYPLDAFFGRAVLSTSERPEAAQVSAALLDRLIGDKVQPGDIIICRNSDAASKAAGQPAGYPTLTRGRPLVCRARHQMLGMTTTCAWARTSRMDASCTTCS